MRIAMDVDDVVLDFTPQWVKAYNRDYGDSLDVSSITEWDMKKFVVPECSADIYNYLLDPVIYSDVEPVAGALTGCSLLKEAGHTIVYITVAHNSGKLAALQRYGFVDEKAKNYVVAADKNVICADIIIDDNPANIEAFNGKAILFTRPWNTSFNCDNERVTRIDNWSNILSSVLRISLSESPIKGVGKNTPTTVNENGGRQSALEYRFDLVDPVVLFNLANILYDGAEKYGVWNWRRISVEENINHALSHIYAYMAGDGQDDHVGHAFCRLMFAQSLILTPGECKRMLPKSKEN